MWYKLGLPLPKLPRIEGHLPRLQRIVVCDNADIRYEATQGRLGDRGRATPDRYAAGLRSGRVFGGKHTGVFLWLARSCKLIRTQPSTGRPCAEALEKPVAPNPHAPV